MQENKIPMPLVVAGVVLAIGVAVYAGWASFGPKPPAPLTSQEKDNQAVIVQIVKRSNGDFSKVSPEDMATLQKIAGNFAAMAYGDVAKKVKNGQL